MLIDGEETKENIDEEATVDLPLGPVIIDFQNCHLNNVKRIRAFHLRLNQRIDKIELHALIQFQGKSSKFFDAI